MTIKITPQEVELLSAYIFKISGITLDKSKSYLVENRLKPLLTTYNSSTFKDLYDKSQVDKSGNLKRDIIDAISTNETFFFRDNKPFDLLRNKIIPELIDRRQGQGLKKIPLRIWSAACSTGQEVYSIAMILHEILPNIADFEISILGTDISGMAVQRASYGQYNQFEIQRGLSEDYRRKYFTIQGNNWRIKDKIRAMAQFKKINLLRPFDDIRGMDVVFCRNVAIYFNPPDKKRLFDNIAKVMVNDGALIVGGSETLTNISKLFQSKQYLRTIYYMHNTVPLPIPPPVVFPKPVAIANVQQKKIKSRSVVSTRVRTPIKSIPKKTTPKVRCSPVPSTPPVIQNKTLPETVKKISTTNSTKTSKISLLAKISTNQKRGHKSITFTGGNKGTKQSLLAKIYEKRKSPK